MSDVLSNVIKAHLETLKDKDAEIERLSSLLDRFIDAYENRKAYFWDELIADAKRELSCNE